MALKEQLQRLATERNTPCITISLNTHRTHPANLQDKVLLKDLLKEAEVRVISEFGKRNALSVLDKINTVYNEIDVNYNLDSLHIFLSNETLEIVKSPWKILKNTVYISESFAIRSLVKNYNLSESYLVLVLSKGSVNLFEAINDGIVKEISNDDFSFSENRFYTTSTDKGSEPKQQYNLDREFLNIVDKALVKIHEETGLKSVVISTEDNYILLQQVTDKPGIYYGYANIEYNKTNKHQIELQSWDIIKETQKQRRKEAVTEMQEALVAGKVVTDLQEIFQTAIDGRGDLLIVHHDFSQSVLMKDSRTFEFIDDSTAINTIDYIKSAIAWEVISKKGRVVFTTQDEIKEFGNIVLKAR